ncbi:hypothetical protein MKZ38_003671 [Zalerion maritima]|uniref:Uncharacterized protein n=1 Tax=Zalerion maritima TaxID=339359 RepID=A0AAD5WS79_9PEZI|nr:hypothetical protein MKZ38_003671 [Zalerion maritima]
MAAASLLYGAALLGTTVVALAAPQPAKTVLPHLPFNAMNPVPTAAAMLSDEMKLRLGRRADSTPVLIAPDNTCGYVSGLSIASFTCIDSDATCVLVSSTGIVDGFVGCCGADDCGYRTTCVDSSQMAAGDCGTACSSNTNIVKCPHVVSVDIFSFSSASSLAFCNSISFSGGAVDYFCGDTTASGFLEAETTFDGQTGRTYITYDLAETSSDLSSASGSSSNVIGNIETVFVTASPTNTDVVDDDDGGGSSSSTNIGAIVGGVVGGVAVIAIVAVGIWLIMRKKKKPAAAASNPPPNNNNNNNNNMPPNQPQPGPQMYQNTGAPGYGPQSGGGHQSMYYDPNNPNPSQPGYGPQQGYLDQGGQYGGYQNAGMAAGAGAGAGAAAAYYGGKEGANNLTPNPNNRGDSTSPVSNFNRFSQQPPVSPNSTTGTPSYVPMHGVLPQAGQPQGPVEAGGSAVGPGGEPGGGHHKGQLHEMA